MEDIKFCKNCVYASDDTDNAYCYFDSSSQMDDNFYVTGNKSYLKGTAELCSSQRGRYPFAAAGTRTRTVPACGSLGTHFLAISDETSFEYGTIQKFWSKKRKSKMKIFFAKRVIKRLLKKLFGRA